METKIKLLLMAVYNVIAEMDEDRKTEDLCQFESDIYEVLYDDFNMDADLCKPAEWKDHTH